jgi:PAS domain S-box-containing protein
MGLRVRILFPLGLAAVLQAIYVLARTHGGWSWFDILALMTMALLLLIAVNVEVLLLRPLHRLHELVDGLEPAPSLTPQSASDKDDLKFLADRLAGVHERIAAYDAKLAHEAAQRMQVDLTLRELKDRYLLAVERANDGIWECDLKTNLVQFSPRWRGMLGYFDERPVDIGNWKRLLHPDDEESVLMRFANHAEGLTPHFDAEYRLRHSDGHYRWLHSRGTALRHASGKAYRMIVMDNDIHARKELEETLIQAAEGLSSVSGEEFFRVLMRNLSAILGTRDNLVCYCVGDPPTHAHTLAYYSRGEFAAENFAYELEGTSCGAVIAKKEIVYCPSGVSDVWPVERTYDRDSYLGVPMFDSTGKIIGHFACMDGKPMSQDIPHLAIFKIFSVRAAAELERTLLKQKLGAIDAG